MLDSTHFHALQSFARMTDLGNLVEETQQILGKIIQKVIARGVQGVKLETVYKRSTNSLDRLDRSWPLDQPTLCYSINSKLLGM